VQEAADLKAKLEEEARAAEATSNATEKVGHLLPWIEPIQTPNPVQQCAH